MVVMIVIAMEAVHVSCASVDLALPTTHGHRSEPPVRQLKGFGTQSCGTWSRSKSKVGRLAPGQFAASDQQAAAFDIEEPQADQNDESIAYDLDQMNGQSDRLGGCAKQNRGDGHNDNGNDGLDTRGHK